MGSEGRQLRYMKQLDSLRAIAIFGVLWQHWLPERFQFGVDWGHLGVQLFFVLSGFLITGILLDCRQIVGQNPTKPLSTVRLFYVRRFLRIFPLFYTTLFLAAIINFPVVRSTLGWHLTYMSNVYFFRLGHWAAGPINHLWSLAVEEQFYLVWPWLIIFLPSRWVLPVIIGGILSAVLFRWLFWLYVPGSVLAGVLTPSCLDSLGMGALLSCLSHPEFRLTWTSQSIANVFLAIGLPLWILVFISSYLSVGLFIVPAFEQLFLAMIYGWVVLKASRGWAGKTGKILEFGALVYLGKISFGLYVLHSFAPFVLRKFTRTFNLQQLTTSLPVSFLLLSLITIGGASLSWHFFEKPLNGLKRFFPYNSRPPLQVHEAL